MKKWRGVERALNSQDVKNILLRPSFLKQAVQSQLHLLTSVGANFFLFKITDYI